eukprot:TRINITY_DN289_c0_g1_i2.p1 TRINITY_DN289_c0_g1~~TRINITY_DN289_c0_g1_i2.p1  ORF type:complete len:235 (-),score=25.01 TRINITY_DN289_c0_g1_i2:104-808(-)
MSLYEVSSFISIYVLIFTLSSSSFFFFFLMIRRPPRSTLSSSSAASDVYKRQVSTQSTGVDRVEAMSPKVALALVLFAAFACADPAFEEGVSEIVPESPSEDLVTIGEPDEVANKIALLKQKTSNLAQTSESARRRKSIVAGRRRSPSQGSGGGRRRRRRRPSLAQYDRRRSDSSGRRRRRPSSGGGYRRRGGNLVQRMLEQERSALAQYGRRHFGCCSHLLGRCCYGCRSDTC